MTDKRTVARELAQAFVEESVHKVYERFSWLFPEQDDRESDIEIISEELVKEFKEWIDDYGYEGDEEIYLDGEYK